MEMFSRSEGKSRKEQGDRFISGTSIFDAGSPCGPTVSSLTSKTEAAANAHTAAGAPPTPAESGRGAQFLSYFIRRWAAKVLLQLHIKMTIHLGQMESTSAVQVRFNTNMDRCKAPHEHNEGGDPHGRLRENPKLKYAVSVVFFCFFCCATWHVGS